MIQGSTADALVCINLNQLPVWMLVDKVGIVVFLKLVGGSLAKAIGGNPDVNGYITDES